MKQLPLFLLTLTVAYLTSCNTVVSPQTDTTGLWPAGKYFEEDNHVRYGFINRKGEFIIEPQYGYASSFSGGYAVVYDESDKRYHYIDANGNRQNFSSEYPPDLFYYGFAKVPVESSDTRYYGFIDVNFNYALDDASGLTSISDHMTRDGYIWAYFGVNQNTNSTQYGYLHADKNQIVQNAIDVEHSTYLFAADFIDGYAVTATDKGFGIINTKYEVILEYSLDNGMLQNIGYGLFAYRQAADLNSALRIARTPHSTPVTKIINAQGNIIADNINYNYIEPFMEGEQLTLFCNSSDSKYGYINKSGREVIKALYDYAENFSEGYAFIGYYSGEDYSIAMIDKNGKTILNLGNEFEIISYVHNGLFLTFGYDEQLGEVYSYKDLKGNVIYSWRNEDIPLPCAPRRFSLGNGARPVKHYALGGC